MKPKKTNPSTKEKKPTIFPRDSDTGKSPWLEDYLDLQGFKLKPVTEATIDRISQELLEWSKREDSIVFRDFYDDKGIPEDAYYRWVRTHQQLKAAHAIAKGRVGSRREKGALIRKYDPSFITNSMPMYDQEWKDLLSWKASLKEQSSSNAPVTINLPNITTIPTIEHETTKKE